MKPRPNRILSEPATPEACRRDLVAHNRPETAAAAREQRDAARDHGNEAAGFWHGRRQ